MLCSFQMSQDLSVCDCCLCRTLMWPFNEMTMAALAFSLFECETPDSTLQSLGEYMIPPEQFTSPSQDPIQSYIYGQLEHVTLFCHKAGA